MAAAPVLPVRRVVAEAIDGGAAYLLMDEDGEISSFIDPARLVRAVVRQDAKSGSRITIVDWRNTPVGFEPPSVG